MRARLVISEAWRSLKANQATTIAATLTVLVAMFLLGLFITLGTWTNDWAKYEKGQLVVHLYFGTGANAATTQQENAVARLLGSNPLIKGSPTYVSKEKALKEFKKQYPQLAASLTSNPFPDSFVITPRRAEDLQAIADSLQPLPAGVSRVNAGEHFSRNILSFAHVLEWIFTAATILLLVTSILLIMITVRLSIFSRRREIEVMKLVGATNWFVRGPFMVEGLLTGVAGAVLAVPLLLITKTVASSSLPSKNFFSAPGVHAMSVSLIALIILAMGLVVGALASGITLHRFLRV